MQPQNYQDVYNSLGSVYDPQTTLVNQQMAALPGQEQAQTSALDQAKVNAFKSIDNSANAKGVLFSGFSPDQQASYIGTKYLPALAGIKSQTQQNQFKLQSALNDILGNRSKQAQGIVSDQAKQASDNAYKQAQLQLSYAKLARSGSGGLSASQQYQIQQQQATKTAAGQLGQELQKVAGSDGYISPNDYKKAQRAWAGQGFDSKQFDSLFAGFRNPGNPYYGI